MGGAVHTFSWDKDGTKVEPQTESVRGSRSNLAQELEKRTEKNTKSAAADLSSSPLFLEHSKAKVGRMTLKVKTLNLEHGMHLPRSQAKTPLNKRGEIFGTWNTDPKKHVVFHSSWPNVPKLFHTPSKCSLLVLLLFLGLEKSSLYSRRTYRPPRLRSLRIPFPRYIPDFLVPESSGRNRVQRNRRENQKCGRPFQFEI